MIKEKYIVTGMSCAACSSRVEKTVSGLDGTEEVSVNLLTGTMQVAYDENKIKNEDIVSAVEKAGYGAQLFSGGSGSCYECGVEKTASASEIASRMAEDEMRFMERRLILSVLFLIPLMAVSMSHMFMPFHNTDRPLTSVLIQGVLLIPIVFLNRKYYMKGFPALFRGNPNMDTLIAIGSAAATVYGIFAIFRMTAGYETGNTGLVCRYSSDVYFESAAMILTLITVGKYLEARSKGKTSRAIEKLINLAPKEAVIEVDGTEVTVSADALKPGEIMVIRPGEAVAADGEILSGTTSLDESAITGEGIPAEKQQGDKVISATVNLTGFIRVRVEKSGKDTTLSQIIRLVEEAGASKAPVARLVDKISGIFVPVVMAVAFATAVIWLICGADFEFALSTGIAVLVISCPCALGLATPVAIMVGTGKGAENGILIKSGQALETMHSVDTVVLDKTGTVTEGRPVVTDVLPYSIPKETLLEIAGSLEHGSEHSLAGAVKTYVSQQKIEINEVNDFRAIFGKGIEARIDGKLYVAGNDLMMREKGLSSKDVDADLKRLSDQGKTPLLFADENRIIGLIAVADTEKESSRTAVEEFAEMNINVVMLTGDNRRTAEAVRRRMNIPEVISEVLPQDKEKHIAELQEQGHTVAMIGDGINDAPALAKANVGIAIGGGTDVAIESADAVLMHSDLQDAVTAVKLSKAVMKNIKENLFWAFFYNIIGIPLAAGVLYPVFGLRLSPMFGAAAMSLSSVCVVLNALRLRRFKIKRDGVSDGVTYGISEGVSAGICHGTSEGASAGICGNRDGQNEQYKEDNKQEAGKMKYELKIEGMMCMHCQKHMADALNDMEGVRAVVDLESGIAHVEAANPVSREEFEKAVKEAGYELKSLVEGQVDGLGS